MRLAVALFILGGLLGANLVLLITSARQLADAMAVHAEVDRLSSDMHNWLSEASKGRCP